LWEKNGKTAPVTKNRTGQSDYQEGSERGEHPKSTTGMFRKRSRGNVKKKAVI